MKILALKPKGLALPFIHSSLIKAFRSLGVEVGEHEVPHGAESLQSFLGSAKNRFDAGFVLDMGVDPSFIQNFREIQITLKIPWIIWFVDDPEGYNFPDSCEPEWTHVFCWDQEIARRLSSGGIWRGRPVGHLPLAADPEIFFPKNLQAGCACKVGIFVGSTRHGNSFLEKAVASLSEFKETETKLWRIYSRNLTRPLHDLLWDYLAAGQGKPIDSIKSDPLAKIWIHTYAHGLGKRKRVEVVSRLLNGGLVFGDEGWREFLPDSYRGRIGYGGELRAAYTGSSFVLDVRQPQSRTGLTQRVFDAGSCGVPVLTEWTPELEILFDAERELFSFRTIEEGVRKREELIQSIPAGRQKARYARRRVLDQHTYTHRARKILESLREDRY